MAEYHREINFEKVRNFRDIGGYPTRNGRIVAWRRIFRSAELRHITRNDLARFQDEIGLVSVLDLRSEYERNNDGQRLLSESGFRFFYIPFTVDDETQDTTEERLHGCTNLGEFYLQLMREPTYGRRIVQALDIIADSANHPLVFHCAAGKDRTGILSAMLLSILGVKDEDIKYDYHLSTPYIQNVINGFKEHADMPDDLKSLPDYFWCAAQESMALLLRTLRREYSSVKGYLRVMGAVSSQADRLRRALLE
jgi:protein-tyrosine phosphatase